MKQKYLIGYTPKDKPKIFMDFSQRLSFLSHTYCLGENSFPHVTLAHFYWDEEGIDGLWENILKEPMDKNLIITFDKYGFITFDEKLFWVFLFPNHREVITENHEKVKNHVRPTSLNKGPYDPHLTLINSMDKHYEDKTKTLLHDFRNITAEFTLCLGDCDEAGQLTRMIERA